jgi:hypothetical protein
MSIRSLFLLFYIVVVVFAIVLNEFALINNPRTRHIRTKQLVRSVESLTQCSPRPISCCRVLCDVGGPLSYFPIILRYLSWHDIQIHKNGHNINKSLSTSSWCAWHVVDRTTTDASDRGCISSTQIPIQGGVTPNGGSTQPTAAQGIHVILYAHPLTWCSSNEHHGGKPHVNADLMARTKASFMINTIYRAKCNSMIVS